MMIGGVDMLPGRAEFPRDQWYVAAFGFEVTRTPLHRMLFGDPVVLFRQEDGEPVALLDRCPHRGMRLSNGGKLIGDTIECPYHGIRFNSEGRACLIPSGGTPTSAMSTRRYPLVEVDGWIWAWAGDADKADTTRLPDHREVGLTAEGFHSYYGVMLELDSNYLYSFENLVDATHISYLHHGMIDSGNVAGHPYEVVQDGVKVTVTREFKDELIAPMVRRAMQLEGERADRTLELKSYAPNLCVVRLHFTEAARSDAPRRDNRAVFAVTPSGAKSCYQFVAFANNYVCDKDQIFADVKHLLMEDVIALNDVQKLFDMLEPDRVPEVSVRSDEAAIRSRRIIAKQIQSEKAQVLQTAE